MGSLRILLVVIWIAIAGVSRGIWSASAVHAHPVTLRPSSTAVSGDGLRPRTVTRDEPVTDRFGNDIEDAVGDYRVDPSGELYERHSPETEVPRLPPPGA